LHSEPEREPQLTRGAGVKQRARDFREDTRHPEQPYGNRHRDPMPITKCLAHFVIFGEKHLHYISTQFLKHYHFERPHQGRGNVPLSVADPDNGPPLQFPNGEIECRERLGGLLRHYYRAAA
jgi:hypothetical protein